MTYGCKNTTFCVEFLQWVIAKITDAKNLVAKIPVAPGGTVNDYLAQMHGFTCRSSLAQYYTLYGPLMSVE